MADRKDPLAGTQPQELSQAPPQYGGASSSQQPQQYNPYNPDAIGSQHTGASAVSNPYYSQPGSPQAQDAGPAAGYYAGQQPMSTGSIGGVQQAPYGSQPQSGNNALGAPSGTQSHPQAFEMHQPGQSAQQHNYSANAQQTQLYGQEAYPQQTQSQAYQQTQAKYGHGSTGAAPTQAAGGAANEPPNYSKYRNPVPLTSLSAAPSPVDCPSCHQRTMTRTQTTTGNTTNAWAAGLCLIACLGCIPYCIDSTKDVLQYCGNCNVLLATWHRSGRVDVHMHS